eukprot:999470-Pleurochrysis_carterae.AAC.1
MLSIATGAEYLLRPPVQEALRVLNDERDYAQQRLQRTLLFQISKRRLIEREVASARMQIAIRNEELFEAGVNQVCRPPGFLY